jgi:hypothetical protein
MNFCIQIITKLFNYYSIANWRAQRNIHMLYLNKTKIQCN